MLSTGVTYGVMIATLVVVAAYAILASRSMDVHSVKNFLRFVLPCLTTRALACLLLTC